MAVREVNQCHHLKSLAYFFTVIICVSTQRLGESFLHACASSLKWVRSICYVGVGVLGMVATLFALVSSSIDNLFLQ